MKRIQVDRYNCLGRHTYHYLDKRSIRYRGLYVENGDVHIKMYNRKATIAYDKQIFRNMIVSRSENERINVYGSMNQDNKTNFTKKMTFLYKIINVLQRDT